MTFEQWWESEGCRKECLTHEERAKQAWSAAIISSWDVFVENAGNVIAKAFDDTN